MVAGPMRMRVNMAVAAAVRMMGGTASAALSSDEGPQGGCLSGRHGAPAEAVLRVQRDVVRREAARRQSPLLGRHFGRQGAQDTRWVEEYGRVEDVVEDSGEEDKGPLSEVCEWQLCSQGRPVRAAELHLLAGCREGEAQR